MDPKLHLSMPYNITLKVRHQKGRDNLPDRHPSPFGNSLASMSVNSLTMKSPAKRRADIINWGSYSLVSLVSIRPDDK
jgi:hypothetical protein